MAKDKGDDPASSARLAHRLRVRPDFVLADLDPAGTPGFDGGESKGGKALEAGIPTLSDLQERLFADSRGTAGPTRTDRRGNRVLLVLQGMDTSGKGGIQRHVVGAVDPQGVRHAAFKKPTAEELAHDFLWRIRKQLPDPGEIGVFDRSHYEDVLVVRVHELVPAEVWQARYDTINAFEAELADAGTVLIKVMLHISPGEQLNRLAERLDRPDKYWKYNPGDLDEHAFWSSYQEAYQVALTRCCTEAAPWYVVPADHKWYARWAVQQLLLDALQELDPQWPPAGFDVEAEQARVRAALAAGS